MIYSNLERSLMNVSVYDRAAFVSGIPGSGKTFTALKFCSEHKESLYFSFEKSSHRLCASGVLHCSL